MGKAFRLSVEAPDEAAAAVGVIEMAQRLLANPVIEDFEVRVLGPATAGAGGNGRAGVPR